MILASKYAVGHMEVREEITNGLSIGTMTFDSE